MLISRQNRHQAGGVPSGGTVHRVSKNTGWLQPTHEHCFENLYYLQNLCAEAVTIASFRIPCEPSPVWSHRSCRPPIMEPSVGRLTPDASIRAELSAFCPLDVDGIVPSSCPEILSARRRPSSLNAGSDAWYCS